MENYFRPVPSGVRKGPNDFAADIETPVWQRHSVNSDIVEKSKDAIADENRRVAQEESRMARPEKWESGVGTVRRKSADGTVEEFDANDLIDDPDVGHFAEQSLFKKDIFDTKNEVKRRSLLLQDPTRPKRLTEKEREDIKMQGKQLQETDPEHIRLKKTLMDDEALEAEENDHKQAIYQGKTRLQEYGTGGIQKWREARQTQPTLDGAVQQHAAVTARAAELDQRAQAIAAEEADLAKPMKGADLAASAPQREAVALKREQLAADRASHQAEQQRTAAAVSAEARKTADAMDGKPPVAAAPPAAPLTERDHREIAAKYLGTGTTAQGLSGQDPGAYAKVKGGLNQITDVNDGVAMALRDAGGDIDKAIAIANKKVSDAEASQRRIPSVGIAQASGFDAGKTSDTADAAKFSPAAKQLEAMKAEFDAAGVNPKDRARIIQDAAKSNAWTEKDEDRIRALSTGELAINPGRVFGDKAGIIAEINASSSDDASKQHAIAKLDAMREAMAGKIFTSTVYTDDDFKEFAGQKIAAGNQDQAAILDEWSKTQKDRNWAFKATDAIGEGIKTGAVGIDKTLIGTAAGLSALVGADETAATLGKLDSDFGGVIQREGEASKLRGITGNYAITSDLTNTVTQMAPMLVGGQVAQGLNGISKTAVGGMSVYGWAAAQGYESKLSDAVDMAREKKGSDLTGEEIAAVLGDGKTQVAGFLNGAQTAVLSKVLGGGVERAALGKAASSMTVRDFLGKGGAAALRDGVLKKELAAMGKTILGDVSDEAVEEFTNQVLDGAISTVALGKDMKLGDLLEESFKAGAMGALVGGGLPQIRKGESRGQSPADPVARVNAEILATNPDATPATPEEVTAAAAIVGEAPTDLAEGISIEREISAVEANAAPALEAAEAQLQDANLSGDKGAVTAAEENLKKVRGTTAAGSRARGALKIARGEDISTLTDSEARSLGIKRKGDGFVQMTGKELEAEGLKRPLLDFGADDSPIILDEVLSEIRNISPAAAARVKMSETEARKAATQRKNSESARSFTVTGKNGTTLLVAAKTPEEANSIATTAPSWPMGEQVATTDENTPSVNPGVRSESEGGTQVRQSANETRINQPEKVAQPTQQNVTQPDGSSSNNGSNEAPVGEGASESVRGDGLSGRDAGSETREATSNGQDVAGPIPEVTPNSEKIGSKLGAPEKTAIVKRVARLKKNPKLQAAIQLSTDPADRVEATEDGKIIVNLKTLADEAAANGLQGKQAETWIAGVIDEEIRHLAQYDAARSLWDEEGDFKQWRSDRYAALWQNEFVAKGDDAAVRDLYGHAAFDALEDWQKAFEGLRMVSQKLATGNPTEASKLLIGRGKDFIAHLRAALKALKDFVAGIDASPALSAEIAAIEAALLSYESSNTAPKDRPKKPPTDEAPEQNLREAGKGSDSKPASDGANEPGGRGTVLPADASPVGRHVTWQRNGESLSGVIDATNEGFARVRLDAKDAKGVGTALAKLDSLTFEPLQAREWELFSPESGSLGIPREEMPQIHASDRSAMVQFLKARGIDYVEEEVAPDTLKPTQLEYSPEKVQKAREFEGGNRAILISEDNQLVDGHHQWVAALDTPSEPIRVIRLMAPIEQVLETVATMPSVENGSGANSTQNAQQPDLTGTDETQAVPSIEQNPPTAEDSTDRKPESNGALANPRTTKKTKKPSSLDLLENYFQPGKIVPGYAGDDRVISFSRGTDGNWSVTVEGVDGRDEGRQRTHATMPSNKVLLRAWQNRETVTSDTPAIERESAQTPGKPVDSNSNPPTETKAKRKRRAANSSRVQEIFSSNPFVMSVMAQGGMMSASRAKREMGKEWWSENSSLYDDAPVFTNPTFNAIYTRTGSLTPDKIADGIAADGFMPTGDVNRMWDELRKAAASTTSQNKQVGQEIEKQGVAEKQAIAFAEKNQERNGSMGLQVGDFEVGHVVTVDGVELTVESNDGETVVLADGDRFGKQSMNADDAVWIDADNTDSFFGDEELDAVADQVIDAAGDQEYESSDELLDTTPELVESPQANSGRVETDAGPQSRQDGRVPAQDAQAGQVKPAPVSKMDTKNADSRELFADDGGFKLGQDTTVDGAKVVAERKAKEDAKAAQDAAQGDIFAPPALSAGKQALKDAFSDMVDGLEAAPLATDGFYNSKGIPREKRGVFMDVADKLYDEGIRTPEALAAALEEVGGGKLRAYSDAVWSVLRSNYPDLPQAGDWAGIYSNINDTTSNDSTPGTSLESDRGDAGSPDASGQGGVPSGRGSARGNGKRVVSAGNGSGNAAQDHLQPDDESATPERVGSDRQPSERSSESAGRAATFDDASGSRTPDASGVEAYGRGENDTHDGLVIAASTGTLAHSGVEGLRDVASIKKSVPSLKVEQAEDVAFVEERLLEKGKPGALLTNGTGTGKTFSGLGVVKRALDRGEKHVIIVAPSDKVVNDWIDTAREFFGISDIAQLDGITDNSPENRVVVTTYANFGQNNDLVRRPWGMVVTDEAHYLSQAKDGNNTLAQSTFKGLTWHPKDGVGSRVAMEMADELAELSSIRKSIDSNSRLINRDDTMDQMVSALKAENQELEKRANELSLKIENRRKELKKVSAGMKESERPKAVFLSATPFAYHFSLDYAEGYLFEHGPEPTSNAYNTPSARGKFYMENFGYRMRYGKLTQPENAAATGILERMFAEKLKRDGAMRGRMLQVPFDYSRDFVLAESMIGTKVDQVIDLIRSDKRFEPLRSELEIGDYLARRYLLEGLKARESVKRIKEHLALGRKVVVFHDYKKNNATNPLRLSGGDEATKNAYATLRSEFPGFDELVTSLDGLLSPIEVIRRNFPDAGFFNGNEPKAKRRSTVKEFNRSGGKMNVILAQRAAGKEGISLHDTDGKHQRAFIDLGLPGRPTDAIQSEGRTIRLGMQSNGVLEYLTTGTNFERHTFAQTIATRASTAENLAMGESARSLLQSFSTGYNEARVVRPSKEQGTGGKKADAAREAGDPFDNAVALYFTNQKKTARTKAAEGIDYFATPEPVGFKMVEWANIRTGERVLEPSGGHGAIARFFPDSTTRHAVEPSYELAGRLALNAPDTKIHQVSFEDYDVVNKFDAIVMNPPFGTAGKTAMDHLEKAVKHLKDGGRVVALIPQGSSMEKRFDKWYESVEGVFLTAEIKLPSVAFERAGTSVSSRIVVLDKVKAEDAKQQVSRDFTSASSTKELFERIKDSSIPERPSYAVEKTPAAMVADLVGTGSEPSIPTTDAPKNDFSPMEFTHTRDGHIVFVAKINRGLGDNEYSAAKASAKRHGGNYSSFRGKGAIPGFHFKDADSRDAFIGSMSADVSLKAAPLADESPKPLRADSPEWKAMSKDERMAYLKSRKGLQAAPLTPDSAQEERIKKLSKIVGTPPAAAMEEVAEQQRVFKSSGKKVAGRPDLANPGQSEESREFFDQIDEARKWHATRETWAQWTEAAQSRAAKGNERNLIEQWLANAAKADKAAEMTDGDAVAPLSPEDTIAFRIMMERRTREAGGDKKALAENAVLRNAYRSARAGIARSLAAGRDIFKTPEQRNREFLVNLISDLSPKEMRQIEARKFSSQKAKEDAIQAAALKRLTMIEKELAKRGITLEEILGKEIFLSLSQTAVMKGLTQNLAAADKMAVQMMQNGAGLDHIRKRTGLPEEKIQAIRDRMDKELRAKLYDKVKAGLTLEDMRDKLKGDSLSASPLNAATPLTEEQIQKELDRIIAVGFGIPQTIQKKSGLPRKKVVEETDDEEDPDAAAKRVIKRWTDRLATSQSDTLAWKSKDGKLTPEAEAMEKLIREHLKAKVDNFIEKAVALGAPPEQARVIDSEAGTERHRKALIERARKEGKTPKAGPTAQEIADGIAKRWIDKLATSQSDTLSWTKKGDTNELEALIREHLKSPVVDFEAKAVALGATPEQARILNGEATTERARKEMIAKWRKENPKARPTKPKAAKIPNEVDWNRPEFTDGLKSHTFDDKGRADVMNRVVQLRDIVGAAGKVETLTGDQKAKAEALLAQIDAILAKHGSSIVEVTNGGMSADDYRFNIADRRHVDVLARTIQAMDSDWIDKGQEYAYASMLSGLQTNEVNLLGGIANTAWQATGDRMFESMANLFINDPNNATFGEVKYMLRAMGPMLSRAWSNAVATWGSEMSMFEEDILNRPPDLAKMAEGTTGYRTSSIGGTKGRVIRTPLRLLLAADTFVNTARASVEVGAMAYRMARASGLKPGTPEFDAFVKKEVNIPGSIAWQMAAQKAYEGTFNNALPGQKDALGKKVEVKTSMDALGKVVHGAASILNPEESDSTAWKLGKALMKMLFFPFVRVPFNIMKQGIERSINPISAFDMAALLGQNLRYKDGKWTLNAAGDKARIIENIGKQMQGAMLMALLASLGEGDDDDLKKRILITGSRPYKETKKGERELGYRMGLGPYEISFLGADGKRHGFSYGRIEPAATVLGGTIDSLKNAKAAMKGRIGKADAIQNISLSFLAQANEKTMLRGMADLMAITNNDKPLDRFAADRIGTLMPNLVKQAVRESDDSFREYPTEFSDMVLHSLWPSGMGPARLDLYGDPQKKEGTAAQRIVDFTDAGTTPEPKETDEMLYNWIRQNPDNKEVPIPTGPGKTWKDPVSGEQKQMTAGQRAKFGEIAGTRLRALTKHHRFNTDKPTEYDMKLFKKAIDQSRDDARKILFKNNTWRNLK